MESTTEKVLFATPIADPIASDKLSTKLLQLTTKCKQNYLTVTSGQSQIDQKRSQGSQQSLQKERIRVRRPF